MISNSLLTVNLSRLEKERLHRLALRYGLSLQEFSKKVLEELTSEFLEESWRDYESPKVLRASFAKASHEYYFKRMYGAI